MSDWPFLFTLALYIPRARSPFGSKILSPFFNASGGLRGPILYLLTAVSEEREEEVSLMKPFVGPAVLISLVTLAGCLSTANTPAQERTWARIGQCPSFSGKITVNPDGSWRVYGPEDTFRGAFI